MSRRNGKDPRQPSDRMAIPPNRNLNPFLVAPRLINRSYAQVSLGESLRILGPLRERDPRVERVGRFKGLSYASSEEDKL